MAPGCTSWIHFPGSWWILGTLNGSIGLSIETYYCCFTGKYKCQSMTEQPFLCWIFEEGHILSISCLHNKMTYCPSVCKGYGFTQSESQDHSDLFCFYSKTLSYKYLKHSIWRLLMTWWRQATDTVATGYQLINRHTVGRVPVGYSVPSIEDNGFSQ